MDMFVRMQILEGSGQESIFLWGARQTGKSTLLRQLFPDALWFDLLNRMSIAGIKKNPFNFAK